MVKSKRQRNKRKIQARSLYTKMYVVLGVILITLAFYNLYNSFSLEPLVEQRVADIREAATPPELQVVSISSELCVDCPDLSSFIWGVESSGANITAKEKIDFSSEKAKSLIKKYNIKKIPTIIISGEFDKWGSVVSKLEEFGSLRDDAYVFTQHTPPFVETESEKIRGKVSLVHLKKSDCEDCLSMAPLIGQLIDEGVKFSEQKEVDISSKEGRDLIDKYNIKKIPTVIMDAEAEVYPIVIQDWSQIGTIEDDGSFVVRRLIPLYYSVDERRVKGLVSMTLLTDRTCSECYDAGYFHKITLEKIGVVLGEEKTLDISDIEGKKLIGRYNIEKVPTVILGSDLGEYPVLVEAWPKVGTVESDGAYVFRMVELAQEPYKDLALNKVVNPLGG